jgi:hypothetical protein
VSASDPRIGSRDGLKRHVSLLVVGVVGLLLAGYLPWYEDGGRSGDANGYGEPLGPLLPVTLLIGIVLIADGFGILLDSCLFRGVGGLSRSAVRTGAGLLVLGAVSYKYLFRDEGRTVGVFIGLAFAALIAYEAYAIGVAEQDAPVTGDRTDSGPGRGTPGTHE